MVKQAVGLMPDSFLTRVMWGLNSHEWFGHVSLVAERIERIRSCLAQIGRTCQRSPKSPVGKVF